MLEKLNDRNIKYIKILTIIFSFTIAFLILSFAIIKTIGLNEYNNDVKNAINDYPLLGEMLKTGNWVSIAIFYLFGISIIGFLVLDLVMKSERFSIAPIITVIIFLIFYFLFSEIWLDRLFLTNDYSILTINWFIEKYSWFDIVILVFVSLYIVYYFFYLFLLESYNQRFEYDSSIEEQNKE